MKKLVSVEGHRWAIEDSFEAAKNELGLDHNETRSWHGWHRHVSLVMLKCTTSSSGNPAPRGSLHPLTECMDLPPQLWDRAPSRLPPTTTLHHCAMDNHFFDRS